MNAAVWAQWPLAGKVRAFTTVRHGAGGSLPPFDHFNLGNRHAADGDDPAAVERNRAQLAERFELPSAPHWLRQVHGTAVLRFPAASSSFAGEGTELPADASVTSAPGAVLAILTADCLPVVFANQDGSELGAAHAGWRGLAAGVLENTVAAMQSPADSLVAWLGPAAGPQAYEIGEEVFQAFVAQDADAASAFLATRPGHWRVDLYALAGQRLAKLGITGVHGGGLCTLSDPQRFYSHRRDARTGRMATLAWMRP
ncbi:MAG: peptidoglycan editing factor PgeF [Pseudoxanthomonas sp.]